MKVLTMPAGYVCAICYASCPMLIDPVKKVATLSHSINPRCPQREDRIEVSLESLTVEFTGV